MKEDKERELYWNAVDALDQIIESGNKTRDEILQELEEDLSE